MKNKKCKTCEIGKKPFGKGNEKALGETRIENYLKKNQAKNSSKKK